MQLVECVPNFSEGRDQRVIQDLSETVSRLDGVRLLHVDSSADANRTVVTFVGEPEPVCEAAFQAISRAAELIDMRRHHGTHPRLGAADVCPFVPLAGISLEGCVRLARRVGERVGGELAIPVYLYGAAAHPGRRSLADIRRGEYEGLPEKLAAPEGTPDFGPVVFQPRIGVTAVGARDILIAFNVSLNTTDQALASEIALAVREKGRVKRDADPADGGAGGQIVRDSSGRAVRQPGTLKACRAMGWFMPGYGCAQVSLNLEDFRVTPPHVAFEEVSRQAHQRGLEVTGSELVGMIPLEAMLMAGRYYLEKEGRSLSGLGPGRTRRSGSAEAPGPGEAIALAVDGSGRPGTASHPAEELVKAAVSSMGLSTDRPFEPEERIIEYRLRQEGGCWAEWADRLMICQTAPAHLEEVKSDPS